MTRFLDRRDAGKQLAHRLESLKNDPPVMVLALLRGGVPVAFEVAQYLQVPLDVLVVRKLGVPGHQELAMGAIASGDVIVLNEDIIENLNLDKSALDKELSKETNELHHREQTFRSGRPFPKVAGKTVIVIDDGMATGATMRAGIVALKHLQPKKIIIAIPTSASDTLKQLQTEVDEIICLSTPEPYRAVGVWYESFPQITDGEVKHLLEKSPCWDRQ